MNPEIFLNGITAQQLAEVLGPLLFPHLGEQLIIKKELLTPEEACDFLSCKRTSLWKHTKSGKLKSYGLGNRVYYKREELLEAIKPINH